MNLRRIVADLIDPGRMLEVRAMRDQAVENAKQMAVARVDHTIAIGIQRAELAHLRAQRDALRADVERLLEQAAACAHQHHT